MQPTIGAFEAKTHFAHLLAQAEHGKEITITRRGKPVARLVPYLSHNVNAAQTAANRIRALAKKMSVKHFNWDDWKQYREEGRR